MTRLARRSGAGPAKGGRCAGPAQEVADQAAARLSELTARRGAMTRASTSSASALPGLNAMRVRPAPSARPCSSRWAARRRADLGRCRRDGACGAGLNETAANQAEVALRGARQAEAETRQAHDDARRKAEGLQTEVRTLTNLLRPPTTICGRRWSTRSRWSAAMRPHSAPPLAMISMPPPMKPRPSIGAGFRRWKTGFPCRARRSRFPILSRHRRRLRAAFRISASFRGPSARRCRRNCAGPAAGVARRRCLALGRLHRGGRCAERRRQAPGRAQPPSPSKSRCAKRRQLRPMPPGNSMRRGNRSKREPGPSARNARPCAPPRRRSKLRGGAGQHERQIAERLAQTSALDEGMRRIAQSLDEARGSFEAAQAEFQAIPVLEGLAQELAALRDNVNRERAAYAEARARHDGLEREAKARAERSRPSMPKRSNGTSAPNAPPSRSQH